MASVIALTACGGGGSDRPTAPAPPKATVAADLLRLYGYDASAPLDVKEFKVEQKDGATVHDITYAGPEGRIDAYLTYVGFSWGGSLGAIFSAVERRVGSFVLMSLVPRLSADMRRLGKERGASDLAGYEAAMQPIDAVNYLPHVAPHAVFIQFGAQDTRPNPEESREAADSAGEPKQAKAYDAEHELNAQARADRESWLAQRLGVS
jgi:pimeloyl-ACP methyl ester carboxylesterase